MNLVRRNMMEESGRLSRGNVKDAKDLKADAYDALVIPGGSGVAKNLCNFLLKGPNFVVEPSVEAAVKDFTSKKKPLALCCIAPVIAAKIFGKKFGGPGVEMTMEACRTMGNSMVMTDTNEYCVDKKNNVYTTPCYLKGDAKVHEVFEGIDKMITQMVQDLKSA